MLTVGRGELSLSFFSEILQKNEPISLDPDAIENIELNYQFLKEFSCNKLIYGINTGFGPMAQYKINDEDLTQLQYNLIKSHCSGTGKILEPKLVKALMIARLNSLIKGFSGVHTEVVELLKDLINANVYPCIYEHGGVGASGDLVQLAHLALIMIGEGEVFYDNKILPTKEVFEKLKLKPISIHTREGLALINGTSAMTGIGAVNIIQAKKLLGWSVILSAITNEIVSAYNDHFSFELNKVKLHKGQNAIAAQLRDILKDSKMIRSRSEHLYDPKNIQMEKFHDKVQEYYSLRCVSQVLGPVYDTIEQAETVIVNELNSVNDNPIIDHKNKNIFHGGNFHGDYVSLEMDKLKIAITKLSMLSERQLNYLLNEKLNQIFPPFVNLGKLGLNFGVQGMQFTATSTVAENQSLSFPMYIHSIPNNNDNQDIVSMGCNAALMTKKIIDNSFQVLSIQMIALLQAIDFLKCENKLSSVTRNIFKQCRTICNTFIEDRPMYKEIEQMIQHFENNAPYLTNLS